MAHRAFDHLAIDGRAQGVALPERPGRGSPARPLERSPGPAVLAGERVEIALGDLTQGMQLRHPPQGVLRRDEVGLGLPEIGDGHVEVGRLDSRQRVALRDELADIGGDRRDATGDG